VVVTGAWADVKDFGAVVVTLAIQWPSAAAGLFDQTKSLFENPRLGLVLRH
jgi:hypothetical protein